MIQCVNNFIYSVNGGFRHYLLVAVEPEIDPHCSTYIRTFLQCTYHRRRVEIGRRSEGVALLYYDITLLLYDNCIVY